MTHSSFVCDILIIRKNCFRYLKLMSHLSAAICTTISYTLWVEWYYSKNNYLTLRSKIKVTQRSLWYVTHRLMVIHSHTIYHWSIWKEKSYGQDKKILFKKNIIWPWGQRSRSHKNQCSPRHTALWSCTHIPNIIDLSGKTKKLWSGHASLRSRKSGSGRKKSD